MRELGISHRQTAVEFARRYRVRPRAGWRSAHGWSLTEAAERISAYAARIGLGSGAPVAMTAAHLGEHENWPGERAEPTGRRPTPYQLSLLAAVYRCAVHDLLDAADYEHMPTADWLILDKTAHVDVWQLAGDAVTAAAGASKRRPGTLPSSPAMFRVLEEEMALAGPPGELDPPHPASPGLWHPAATAGRDNFPAVEALQVIDLLTPGLGDDQETEDPVRRRTFVWLASTSLLGSIPDIASDQRSLDAEPFVSVLTGTPPVPGQSTTASCQMLPRCQLPRGMHDASTRHAAIRS